jgi:diadenosine tetraphosphate (Ap4A) HIT family hydrolase
MWDALLAIEHVLLDSLNPTTINIAKFGNVVRHLHWHVMARFEWDAYFPEPTWGTRKRAVPDGPLQDVSVSLDRLDELVAARLKATLPGGSA